MAQPPRHKAFVSYSHRDRKWLEELRPHLRALEDQHLTEIWDDTAIDTGADWFNEIESAMKSARVAVLLISKHFLTSEFIKNKELPRLLQAADEDGLVILPVILTPCRIEGHPVLSKFQSLNPPSKTLQHMKPVQREELFLRLTEEIRKILSRPADLEPAVDPALLNALTLQYETCNANGVSVRTYHKLLLLNRIAPDYISACFSVLAEASQQKLNEWLNRQVTKQVATENSATHDPVSPAQDQTLTSAFALADKEGAKEVNIRHFFRALLLDPDSVTIQKLKTAMGSEHFAALLENAATLPFSQQQTNSIVSSLRL